MNNALEHKKNIRKEILNDPVYKKYAIVFYSQVFLMAIIILSFAIIFGIDLHVLYN